MVKRTTRGRCLVGVELYVVEDFYESSEKSTSGASDGVHGNLTAFEAVLADLAETSPDLVLHGGDLVHGGSMPAEIVDRVRELGWEGVVGNTDEMIWMPESLDEFARTD
jgi:hypothetical protein